MSDSNSTTVGGSTSGTIGDAGSMGLITGVPMPGLGGPRKNDPLADPVGWGLNKLGIFGKPTNYDSVSTQLAQISSRQWQQAASMLYPAESQLISYAESPDIINQQRAQGIADVDNSFASQQADQQRQIGLLGMNPTAAQSDAMNRSSALDKAKAEAGVGNAAADAAKANQVGTMKGFGPDR